ncbi:hypothetical protein TARUN_4053 [Trichoderma arundinaceum]|uniref:Uncharacterized protein n=1 Tax=Trichoderma arundinaceum TaxID=490622 RepID=A0A395NPZ7_TRIAR|nr:hypothetical protein TARUN_4053 [Trichoderma arundinaceum]
MGNTNTKESRSDYPEGFSDGRERRLDLGDGVPRGLLGDPRLQLGRTERSFLSLGGSSASRNRDRPDAPFEHRETKQEREARKLERERVLRAQDRERSIREEHVDGGYLVTMGTYVGTEDFNKAVVRQLQVERKLAPFWRGLNDWSDNWAEHQLIAAARGLPIPAADAPPDPDLIPRLPPPPDSLPTQNLHSLTVEMGPRTLSTASDISGSGNGSGIPSPSAVGPSKGAIKPRARALAAALSVGSRNASSTDLTPKEINLPHDPFVNGQPLEVYLYKDASECPICFLTYPPYLNHTRCCDQPICSECFVQIKRADPHLPEHHPDGQARDPNQGLSAEDPPEMLISEPSACPYCQQPEFGVTYEPPPFRRGLTFSSSSLASNTAMSSQSSLNSTLAPAPTTATPGRRRAHSLSVNAPNVITTDRIRPDWATKLASARAHQARRAAAATALHTAAFLIGGNESRSRIRTSRFGRRNTGTNSGGTTTPGGGQSGGATDTAEGQEPTERSASRNPDGTRRTRMEELEDMMFMEAVRLSLAAEEERKRKVEKALQKEAKKREKEREKAERKALKKQGKDPYGGGLSGASGSSLSLGLGRKRGNSAASNLRLEVAMQSASQSSKAADIPEHERKTESIGDKGKGVDRGPQPGATETASSASLPIPTPSSRGGSHLRQMSNASSLGSSLADSPSGSFSGQGLAGSDATKRQSVGNRSDSGDGETENEVMFNFRSLAEIVGVNLDDGSATQQAEANDGSPRPLSQVKEEEKEEANAEHVERSLRIETSDVSKESVSNASEAETSSRDAPPFLDTPELTITPDTPTVEDGAAEDKRLGQSSIIEHETTQATH